MSCFNLPYSANLSCHARAPARSLIDALNLNDARKRKVKPLRASQSLSETFPCTGCKVLPLEGEAPKENRVARIGI